MAVFIGLLLLAGTFAAGAWCGRRWGSTEVERSYLRIMEMQNGK